MALQKEAEELYEKNIKLRAQVEAYEQMVKNFKSDLYKMLMGNN